MSNLSQFFATGGNKIKRIQRVQATQTVIGGQLVWSGGASIAAVDMNKTILVYNETASNLMAYYLAFQSSYYPMGMANQYGHYAYLVNSTTVGFSGPNPSWQQTAGVPYAITPAQLEVQIIEFE